MFTICPKCTLTLAVTANDLRLGQGYVRCGRCATVFNALVSLSDGGSRETEGTQANQVLTLPEESANDAGLDEALLRLESLAPAEPHDSLESTQEAVVDAPPHRVEATADEVVDNVDVEPEPEPDSEPTAEEASLAAEAGDDDHEAVVDDTEVDEQHTPGGTGTVETIVLEGEGVTQTEEYVDIETIDSDLAEAARQVMTASQPAPFGMAGGEEITLATPDPASDGPEESAADQPSDDEPSDDELMADGHAADEATEVEPAVPAGALPEGGAPSTEDETLGLYRPRVARPPRAPHKLWWVAASALLALILTVQIVHHYRNDLAARPSWYNGLSRTYGFLGLPLTPNWDLRGYDVRQLGAATNGSNDNAIRVRISLANRTSNEQPYPILRLSLFDRFGKRVAARDLQPADYLHAVPEAGKLMSGGQRVDTEVAVLDPGPDASSFELDVCLAGARGLRCANDEPLRSGSRS